MIVVKSIQKFLVMHLASPRLKNLTNCFNARFVMKFYQKTLDLSTNWFIQVTNFSKSHVRDHNRAVHANENPIKCEVCDKNFPRKSQLHTHILSHINGKATHKCRILRQKFVKEKQCPTSRVKRKPYKCEICGLRFRQKPHFEDHHRFFYTDERPYKCEVCCRSFFRRNYLRSHISTHTNERSSLLFKCDICGKVLTTIQIQTPY